MTARFLLALCCTVVLAAGAHAQEIVRIEARVVSASPDGVYLDVGREAGVLEEDRVVLHPAGSVAVDATIRDVSKSTSRAVLPPGSPMITVGTRAEVLVPKERLQPKEPLTPPASEPSAPTPAPKISPPPHPQWTHPPADWDKDLPLLAPLLSPQGSSISGPGTAQLPRDLSGRVYWQLNNTWDPQNGDRRYLYGSLGTELHLENPFGRAGAFDLQADVFQNTFTTPGFPDDSATTFSFRQLSYTDGGTPEVPNRLQVGRFLQHEFPELWIVDGVDWSRRTPSGSRLGVNAGAMPEPFLSMTSTKDTQASVYYRWVADPSERFSLGAAYQNSWHEGKQDRNLFLGTLDYATPSRFSLHSAVWLDYYGSGDTLKSQGVELTEFQTQAFWSFERSGGVGLSFAHRRIPELLREEFANVSPDSVENGRFERIGVNGWRALGEKARLTANADLWEDEHDNGSRGELGCYRRDLLYEGGEVGASVFTVDGSYSSGEGFRVSANKAFSRAFGTLSYEFTNFDQKGFAGVQSTLAHHGISGTIDFDLGKRWNLSLIGDRRFGDEQDSYTLGFLLQVRF